MFTIKMADLSFRIHNQYRYLERQCREYIISGTAGDWMDVESTEEEIREESSSFGFSSFSVSAEKAQSCPGYYESLSVYRKIARILPMYQGFLMHGVVIEAFGTGIALVAASGMGKSTHAGYWKELFGDETIIINGDKPILRLKNGKLIAYGTPWAGKEGLNENRGTELRKICFLERAEENRCERMDTASGIRKLMGYIFTENTEDIASALHILKSAAVNTEYYRLCCRKEPDAALAAEKKLLQSGEYQE